MQEYKTNDGYIIRAIGRNKKIDFNFSGDPFFRWNGRRVKLDEVMRLSYPVFYEDENGKTGAIGGYIGISNCYGVLVEITNDGEKVQLWDELRG